MSGELVKAEDVYQMTATNLNGEFAQILMTSEVSV
jgi:hypothetical protein